MKNRKRITALMLCIGFALTLSVSSAFIAHEAGHDCSGHECPICQMIAVSVNLLRTLGLAVWMLLPPYVLLRGKFAHRIQQPLCLSASDTLVSRKIRLND